MRAQRESPPNDTLGPGEGTGGGRYGYCEATRIFTKAWPAEYDDLWQGIPVPHCRPRRSSTSVGCVGRSPGTLEGPGRRAVQAQADGVEGGRHGRGERGKRAGGRDGPGGGTSVLPQCPSLLPALPHSREVWCWSYITDGSFNPWWKGTWWKQAGTAPPQPLLGTVIHGPPRPGDTVIHGPPRPGESSSSAWAPSGGCSPTYSPY